MAEAETGNPAAVTSKPNLPAGLVWRFALTGAGTKVLGRPTGLWYCRRRWKILEKRIMEKNLLGNADEDDADSAFIAASRQSCRRA